MEGTFIGAVTAIYKRTKKNCLFYEQEGNEKRLLNEIGCLRGIAYCLEELGVCVHGDEVFLRMIALAENMKR